MNFSAGLRVARRIAMQRDLARETTAGEARRKMLTQISLKKPGESRRVALLGAALRARFEPVRVNGAAVHRMAEILKALDRARRNGIPLSRVFRRG